MNTKPPREIKFRLRIGKKIVGYERWDCGDGSNAKWMYCVDPGARYFDRFPEGVWRPDPIYHVDKDQFTGLLSKSGTEIYEGDIIFYALSQTQFYKGVVRWSEDDAGFVTDYFWGKDEPWGKMSVGYEGKRSGTHGFSRQLYGIEVIGNICQNKDLLKTETPA